MTRMENATKQEKDSEVRKHVNFKFSIGALTFVDYKKKFQRLIKVYNAQLCIHILV